MKFVLWVMKVLGHQHVGSIHLSVFGWWNLQEEGWERVALTQMATGNWLTKKNKYALLATSRTRNTPFCQTRLASSSPKNWQITYTCCLQHSSDSHWRWSNKFSQVPGLTLPLPRRPTEMSTIRRINHKLLLLYIGLAILITKVLFKVSLQKRSWRSN
jgi:hypothetical protein